jgi:4-hydroxy-tetrahydrodipicolinate synthase
MTTKWAGVLPAVTTKLTKNQELDPPAIRAGLERLIEAGVGGVVMLGMVGENASLTPIEKRNVLEIAVDTVKRRVPVLSGVAETTTRGAIEFARDAAKIGVDGYMVFPGLTYKSDVRETVAFYRSIARGVQLPIMVYNNPRGYGVDITPDMLFELKDEGNLVAIKEESYDTSRVTDLYNRLDDRFTVICGVDDLIVESAVLGVRSWVSGMANAFPRESVRLLQLCSDGKWEDAQRLYRVLIPLFHLDTHVKLVQYIKLAENVTGGFSEQVREPRLPLVSEERARVLDIIDTTIANLKK